jgi:hypothetical protein
MNHDRNKNRRLWLRVYHVISGVNTLRQASNFLDRQQTDTSRTDYVRRVQLRNLHTIAPDTNRNPPGSPTLSRSSP